MFNKITTHQPPSFLEIANPLTTLNNCSQDFPPYAVINSEEEKYAKKRSYSHSITSVDQNRKKTFTHQSIGSKKPVSYKHLSSSHDESTENEENSANENRSTSGDERSPSILEKISALAELEKCEKSIEKIDELIKKNNHRCESSEDNCYFTAITRNLPWKPENIHENRKCILTGELERHTISDRASEELRENLKIAKKITRYANKVVPLSDNYHQRSKIFNSDYDPNDLVLYQKVIENAIDVLRKKNSSCSLEKQVKKITKYKVGNCQEMSVVGYFYAKDHASVELVEIDPQKGDHVFLIIGRDQRYKLSDYKNWGPHAVLCDLWTESRFPASQIEYLMDCVEVVKIDNMQHTIVRRYNPLTQAIVRRYNPLTQGALTKFF